MRFPELASLFEESVYTFEDIGEVLTGLMRHVQRLCKTEYDGHDKELLEQLLYEIEKAKNVID